jgi:hypothetical protein
MDHDPKKSAELGSLLRARREAKGMNAADVAKVTKIPERLITHLEEGRFEHLPAEIFVRGFLKSYARCVGLDPDDVLRMYASLTHGARAAATREAPPSLARPGTPRALLPPAAPTAPVAPVAAAAIAGVAVSEPEPGKPTDAEAVPVPVPEESLLSQALADAGRGTGRLSLTLAVIILVIVATLTLSLLLRRPSRVGDGVTLVPPLSLSHHT